MTDRYAVIGNPIGHSRSPRIHRAFAASTLQDLSYEAILSPLDNFSLTVAQFFAQPEAKGLNVTLPFKEQAYALSEVLSLRAQQAGAVNTLMKGKDGRLYGDNTDGTGLVRDITQNLGWQLANKRILVVGAGGAVRGVLGVLLAAQPASLSICNRTPAKAQALAELFKPYGHIQALAFSELQADSVDIIINGSSASLSGESLPLARGILAANACAYDMAYGKKDLPFLAWAKAEGAQIQDGLGMLIEQAAESFFIWRGIRVPTAKLLAEIRTEL
ncbi:shikimate dehydrogenase [Agitococcus lubricus]|uniref:Shikimate dehydrogenase (NADP(+)) n=1 Tax=Agitococcus lubricus TaxID=1077255 RepID=A0A2T5IY51_9GAMM|nr:shikimate dehydrogenase [Agitococcus lubricus]PTQ88903.1 shikimate dehydrogenase [Agitococcus lubricus]